MTEPAEAERNVPTIGHQSRTSVVLNIDSGDNSGENRKSCGFHLSRSKWDPYPWVGYVEAGSIADLAGLRAGDCLLEIDGTDIVGLRVKDIASLIRRDCGRSIRLQVWRSFCQADREEEDGVALAGPLPEVAKKLAKAVSGTVQALECPVCLESASSPVSQCVHGHILCVTCRAKTPRCPVCRVRLGQGRCLLADQVQRNIREAFEETHDDPSTTGTSLREKLFGKVKKNQQVSHNGNSVRISPAKVKSTLARLLLGGFDKAASAENLSVATLIDASPITGDRPAAYRRVGELCQNDRTKSASTGELSKGNEAPVDSSIYRLSTDRAYTTASGFLSVPQTPTWGGSTESINNGSFPCPLSRSTSCRETVSADVVLEHLSRSHEGAQVHFYGRTATIPLPLPFDRDSSYVIHHRGDLFFFQNDWQYHYSYLYSKGVEREFVTSVEMPHQPKYENETAWLSGSGAENLGEWTMVGQNSDGTEMKLRRLVARLDDPSAPHSCNLAPLPKALGIDTIIIELLDSRLGEGLEV